MVLIGKTMKGYWPAAVGGKIPDHGDQVVGYPSHPYAMKMNSEYFVALARTFEKRYGVEFQGIRRARRRTPASGWSSSRPTSTSPCRCSTRTASATGSPIVSSRSATRCATICRCASRRRRIRSSTIGCASQNLPLEPQKVKVDQRRLGRREGGGHHALPQGRRGGRHAAGDLRDRQVGELRHRQPVADDRRRPVGVDQPRARQPLGPLRSRDQSARHAHQGRDSGSRQRLDGDRPRQPERLARSGEVRRRVGDQRHLRRVHAADVHAGARLEPAEPGQQVPDGRAAHPGRPLGPGDGGRRPHALRHLRAAGVEAVPARPDDSPELLGLQRRGARPTSRRPRSPRARRRSASSRSKSPGPTSRSPIARRSPTPISRRRPRASTSFATSRPASRGTAT